MSEQGTRKTRRIINEIRASFGAPPTTMTDEQIEAGREVYGAKIDYDMAVIDELQDTREQLEADVLEKHNYMGPKPYSLVTTYDDVIGWLDRQAAITAEETSGAWEEYRDATQREISELKADNERLLKHAADLTAEIIAERRKVKELREAIDAMGNGQFYAMYKAKCEECEQLKKVARTQAESFKKLECELAGKQ